MKSERREEVFRRWLAAHRGILVSISAGFAAPGDRDDLIQEMMIALWHAIPRYRGDASPATLIYRVAHNTALVWSRARRRIPPHEELETDLADRPGRSPAAVLERRERDERLYAAIRTLPNLDRGLIVMHLDGLSYRDMAGVTGLSETNVGARLSRARNALNRKLGGE